MRRLGLAALSVVSVTLLVSACGGSKNEPITAANSDEADEKKAERLLVKARAEGGTARYRQIIDRFSHTQAAETARGELAQLLLAEADAAQKSGDAARAEERAEEARRLGGLATTDGARKILDDIDDRRAAEVAGRATAFAAEGKCASALKEVATPLKKKPRDRFRKAVQSQTQKALVECISKKVQEELAAENLEAARMLIETADATTALSAQGYQEAHRVLEKHIVKKSMGEIEPLLKARQWVAALKKLDEMKQASKLAEQEYSVAVEIVQDAAKAYLVEYARSAITSKDPAGGAKHIEETIEAVRWQRAPDEITLLQATLVIAIECQRLGCKMGAPAAAYAWGPLEVHGSKSATGSKVADIAHAQKFWIVGRGKTHALVFTEQPEKLSGSETFEKAAGWVATDRVRTTDTRLWLPPVEFLAGTRIWGPLRPPAKEYTLGWVVKVDGKTASVKRMSDGEQISVALDSLRIGLFPKGMKVNAFCVDELHTETAKVDDVVQEGEMPKVKVVCDKGGKVRVEVGAGLSSEPSWLPPRKP